MRCELQWSGEVVKGSGVKRVGCEEGGERGSSMSVENTEYEKHVQLRSRYDFAGLKYSDHSGSNSIFVHSFSVHLAKI